MKKTLLLTLALITFLASNVTYAESKKLDEAFLLINQLQIGADQAEMVAQIKANLKEAYQLSEKAQKDLLACLDREGAKKEEAKK